MGSYRHLSREDRDEIAGIDEVQIYSTDSTATPDLRAALAAFEKTLPARVSLREEACSGET